MGREPGTGRGLAVTYDPRQGVDEFVVRFCAATPKQQNETERQGVPGVLVKHLSRRLKIPLARMRAILGIQKATAAKTLAGDEMVRGSAGKSALGVVQLLSIAQGIVARSTAPAAQDFDTAEWLGRWLEQPQPSLGGSKPRELIGTAAGLDQVARVLGSFESGAYQ